MESASGRMGKYPPGNSPQVGEGCPEATQRSYQARRRNNTALFRLLFPNCDGLKRRTLAMSRTRKCRMSLWPPLMILLTLARPMATFIREISKNLVAGPPLSHGVAFMA